MLPAALTVVILLAVLVGGGLWTYVEFKHLKSRLALLEGWATEQEHQRLVEQERRRLEGNEI